MSADNWATCPKCLQKEKDKRAKLEKKLAESYGKIDVEKWEDLQKKAREPIPETSTFREDYELGMSPDGEFCISYGGSCTCGFRHDFNHNETVKV